MRQAYEIASRTAGKEALRGKRNYDKKIHGIDLHPGGRVLVRNLSERGVREGKLRSYWEDKVHIVVKRKASSSPVYEVRPERGGTTRVLHRNLLLPCDSLPLDKTDPNGQRTELRPRAGCHNAETRPRREITRREREPAKYSDSESVEECEYVCRFPLDSPQIKRNLALKPDAQPYVPDKEQQYVQLGQDASNADLSDSGEMEAENTRILEFTENEYPVSSEDAPNDGEPNLQSANCYPCHPKVLTYEELVLEMGSRCALHSSVIHRISHLLSPY
ncbi:hypothetical protein MHYP_G00362200 [Metynnis hypsauchen]